MLKRSDRDKWVAALRSGKYVQGQCCLRSYDNAFCCLGVLANELNQDCWKYDFSRQQYACDDDGNFSMLPLWFVDLPLEMQEQLYELNDGWDEDPWDFNQIADFIEQNVEVED